MIADLFGCALTVVAMCVAILFTPHRATCPRGFYVNGVRPSGAYECRQSPPVDENAPDEIGLHYSAEIYCTGGARAIVVNERTVGCTR